MIRSRASRGWTCTGRTANQTDQCNSVRFANSFFQSNKKDIQELDTDLQRFWEIEEFPVASSKSELNLSLEDNEIYKNVNKNIVYCKQDGRYQVPIPWKEEVKALPLNYSMAFQRLKNTEKKLQKQNGLRENYCEILKS